MSMNPALLAGAKPPAPCQPKPGELLFQFLRSADRFRSELRDHREFGVEAQFYKNEEFVYAHRLPTRELAVLWAEGQRDYWLGEQSRF